MEFSRQEDWSHFLLQVLNPDLPHCRWILYSLSHQGSITLVRGATKKSGLFYGRSEQTRGHRTREGGTNWESSLETCTLPYVKYIASGNWLDELKPCALWQPRGVGWGGRWEGGLRVYLWLIHVDVWQKPAQHCKAIILLLKRKKKLGSSKCSYRRGIGPTLPLRRSGKWQQWVCLVMTAERGLEISGSFTNTALYRLSGWKHGLWNSLGFPSLSFSSWFS